MSEPENSSREESPASLLAQSAVAQSQSLDYEGIIDGLRVIVSRRGYKIQQGDVLALERAINALFDVSKSTEGYPGIAHDLETMRASLQKIADDWPRLTNEGAQAWAREALKNVSSSSTEGTAAQSEPIAWLVERGADTDGYGARRYVTLKDANKPAFWLHGKIADGYTVTPLYARSATPPTKVNYAAVGEARWLIERTYAKGQPAERREFWTGTVTGDIMADSLHADGSVWTTDPMKAARYASREIAERLLYRNFHPESTVEVCEHLFRCAAIDAVTGRTAEPKPTEEPHFWLNGYRRAWRSYSHFQGNRVSYEDVVEWSGINSDSEVIRNRVYTVTYAPPPHSEGRSGTLCPGDFVAFESGMVFNVTRTDKA